MKKTILTFGLISGAISSLMMVATVPFADKIAFDHRAEAIGPSFFRSCWYSSAYAPTATMPVTATSPSPKRLPSAFRSP